jgi:hypothetical protein
MQEEFEDNTGVIKIRKAKMDRQHYGQQLKDKITNNDLQNATQKTKDRATRTPLKFGCELMYSGSVNFSCSLKQHSSCYSRYNICRFLPVLKNENKWTDVMQKFVTFYFFIKSMVFLFAIMCGVFDFLFENI